MLSTAFDVINLTVIRYSWEADIGTRISLPVQWSGLDIHDIPTSQIEKQRYQFCCKNGGKMINYARD